MNLTIGKLKDAYRKNGNPITNINSKDDLEKVRASAVGKKKEHLKNYSIILEIYISFKRVITGSFIYAESLLQRSKRLKIGAI